MTPVPAVLNTSKFAASVALKTPDSLSHESRNIASLSYELASIINLDATETSTLQGLLCHGSTIGIWYTPPEWLTPGKLRGRPSIDLTQRILDSVSSELRIELETNSWRLLDRAVLELTQYAILLRMAPSGTGRAAGRPLGVSNISRTLYLYGPQLFAAALDALAAAHKNNNETQTDLSDYSGQILIHLNLKDLERFGTLAKQNIINECKRMHMLAALGFWTDLPTLAGESRAALLLGPARFNPVEAPRNSHLPLPDDYVATLAIRSLWLIQDLAPNLFKVGQAMTSLWEQHVNKGRGWRELRDHRRESVIKLLAGHQWLDRSGIEFHKPPFGISIAAQNVSRKGNSAEQEEGRWPPRTYTDFMCLLAMVQSAHLVIVLLSTGGRQSEILDLRRNCVAPSVDGRYYLNGRTFKLVQRHEGEARDWQIPDVAVAALEQQSRLVALAERVGNLRQLGPQDIAPSAQHLWAGITANPNSSDTLAPLYDVTRNLVGFARRISLEVSPGGQQLRSHRFRKTLARLVGLALTQSPKILMELFGHKSLEMTLYYILTDKDLRIEIETVSRELRVMRAKEVIEKMVDADLGVVNVNTTALAGYGGLAAAVIRNAVNAHRSRLHRQGLDWDTRSAIELAELLTLQGRAWELVRPGVICTKLIGEVGACNKSKGRTELSKCQSSCNHRLEEDFLREDVDNSIRECVAAYEEAINDEESLTASHWAGQIRAHVPRFQDLRDKWMGIPTVRQIMVGEVVGVVV